MASQEDNSKILELLKRKELACKIEKEAYQRWADVIMTVRFVMIGGAALLACAALFTIIKPLDYINTQDTIIAISCAFLAVILASLHIVLEMDKFHHKIRRTLHDYTELEMACGKAQALSYTDMRRIFDEATIKQAQIKNEARSKPPQWLRQHVELIERKFY